MIDACVNVANIKIINHIELLFKQGKEFNISHWIGVGTNQESNLKTLKLSQKHDFIIPTIGFHPHSAKTFKDDSIENYEKLIIENHSTIRAIGECGLDYNRMFSTKDEQIFCFEKHIELAKKHDKPLYLHERDASDDFISILKNNFVDNKLVHCFTGNKYTLKKYLDLNCYIGITGWICDQKRGIELQEAIKYVPKELLMIETDSPYLTPKNIPKTEYSHNNEPKNLYYVAKKISEILKIDILELEQITDFNTKKFFNIT